MGAGRGRHRAVERAPTDGRTVADDVSGVGRGGLDPVGPAFGVIHAGRARDTDAVGLDIGTDAGTDDRAPGPFPRRTSPDLREHGHRAVQSSMATASRVSWVGLAPGVDWSPFGLFPEGGPTGDLVCTWGTDPELPDDDDITIAWTPIDPESAVAAMQSLEAEGFLRIDAEEGVYLSIVGAAGEDAESYGETFLFTGTDVRWAQSKNEISYITSPTDPR